MDARLIEKRHIAQSTLAKFTEILAIEKSDVSRDAAIQRFEFCYEAMWKYAQYHLKLIEGIELGSPKKVIRACLKQGIFNETQTELAITMSDDKNLTTHTYIESYADKIYDRLPNYLAILNLWFDNMN